MDDWDNLDRMFDDILKQFPQKKRELMEEVGDKMKEKVIENINSAVKGKTGNLLEGVTKTVGSRGGYTAVKPNYSKAPHSHLIENGHKVVRNGEVIGWVNGKHMYRDALEQISDEVEKMAEKMVDELVGEIDG